MVAAHVPSVLLFPWFFEGSKLALFRDHCDVCSNLSGGAIDNCVSQNSYVQALTPIVIVGLIKR